MEAEDLAGRPVFTSALTFAEVHAALVQRTKDRSLTKRKYQICRQAFEADWISLSMIPLDAAVLKIVRDVVSFGLKGADAVQLSTAVWLRDSLSVGAITRHGIVFGASDVRLLNAALAKSFAVFNPEIP